MPPKGVPETPGFSRSQVPKNRRQRMETDAPASPDTIIDRARMKILDRLSINSSNNPAQKTATRTINTSNKPAPRLTTKTSNMGKSTQKSTTRTSNTSNNSAQKEKTTTSNSSSNPAQKTTTKTIKITTAKAAPTNQAPSPSPTMASAELPSSIFLDDLSDSMAMMGFSDESLGLEDITGGGESSFDVQDGGIPADGSSLELSDGGHGHEDGCGYGNEIRSSHVGVGFGGERPSRTPILPAPQQWRHEQQHQHSPSKHQQPYDGRKAPRATSEHHGGPPQTQSSRARRSQITHAHQRQHDSEYSRDPPQRTKQTNTHLRGHTWSSAGTAPHATPRPRLAAVPASQPLMHFTTSMKGEERRCYLSLGIDTSWEVFQCKLQAKWGRKICGVNLQFKQFKGTVHAGISYVDDDAAWNLAVVELAQEMVKQGKRVDISVMIV
ncbi:hypothetical protein DFH27DRAFT_614403 [Peziza echinospora]|nr:hypothetical protein DFH27DRAFT_614403 [Peziza echinospora]